MTNDDTRPKDGDDMSSSDDQLATDTAFAEQVLPEIRRSGDPAAMAAFGEDWFRRHSGPLHFDDDEPQP